MSEAPTEYTEDEGRFLASDGFPLSGRLLLPGSPRAAVLISSATGFPKEFYVDFARFGAERGTACLVYDYRGVAASAPEDLGSFDMDYEDWGRLDMAAALDHLVETAPGVPVVHLANSAGGHLAGFMSNHERVTRQVFVSVGFGTWWTHRFPKQQLMDLFFWWLYGPFYLWRVGYIPAGGLWGGSTLPAGAFLTWRRWSHKGDYFRRELEDTLKPHYFDEIVSPIVSYVFTDDPLTRPASAKQFLAFLPRAKTELRVRNPSDFGVQALDHQGLFRRRNASAWPRFWNEVLEDL